MKSRRAWLLGILFFGLATIPAVAQPPQPYLVPNAEIRVLPVSENGRHYQLYVGLPSSYGQDPKKRYPVVYVTDGYWDFTKITSMQGGLPYDRVVPEFITVGLGYAGKNLNYGDMRRWELSPAPFGDKGEASGHAAEFLQTIKSKIVPFVDAQYRTDPSYRVLAGASLGGLFTLYAMHESPGLFQAYIAATPAVTVDNDWLFKFADKMAKPGIGPKGRLYMTVGGNESPAYFDGIIRFNQRLASWRQTDFAYQFRIIEDERHGGTPFESYTRGLRFAFIPRAPETGPAPGE